MNSDNRILYVAGTGHRPDKLGGHWNPNGLMPAVHVAKDHLFKRMEQAVLGDFDGLHVIGGMALGWDMILGAAALMLRNEGHPITFEAAIPFEGQDAIWRDIDSRKWYARMVNQADKVTIVVPDIERDAQGKVVKHAAIKALDDRNRYMVDACHFLMACWNGTKGGTGNCIRYAESKGKRYDNLWAPVKESLGI